MSFRTVVFAGIIVFFILFGSASGQVPDPHERAFSVSLIRLIANPQIYDGRRVGVAGYVDHNGLDTAVGLYVTELDGRNYILSNSIDLNVEDSKIERAIHKYAILVGTYHAPKGRLADYLNGNLSNVSVTKAWSSGDVTK